MQTSEHAKTVSGRAALHGQAAHARPNGLRPGDERQPYVWRAALHGQAALLAGRMRANARTGLAVNATPTSWPAVLPAAILVVVVAGTAGCTTATREPPNLDPHKQQIRSYVESGAYERELAAVAARANAWLKQRSVQRKPGERAAVVFDLDETLFLNWPYLKRQDFGYLASAWEEWVQAGNAPPIEPVRDVYRAARRLGYAVIFLTGRSESQRAATERNLRAIDCGEYAVLICKSPGVNGTNASFKAAERRRLAGEGWTIVANLGDQQSDLAGGYAERTFKLPGPFYLTE